MNWHVFDTTALVLLIIGGINWGLIGLFNYNVVAQIFGPGSIISTIIYILVGIAAFYTLFRWATTRSHWTF